MRSRLAEEVQELIEENKRLKDGPLSVAVKEATREMEWQRNQLSALLRAHQDLRATHEELSIRHTKVLEELEETKRVLKAYRDNIEIGYPSHKAMMLARSSGS